MATKFDFNNISGLNSFWDGTKSLRGGASQPGGAAFNRYTPGSTQNIRSNLDSLYQNLIGRNADPSGKDYWTNAIASGAIDYKGVADTIKADKEYTGQQDYLANNANATASDLKGLDSAYVSPYHYASGSAAGDWRPGMAITADVANAVTTDPNVSTSNYGDQVHSNVGDIKTAYGAHNAAELEAGGTNFKGTGGIFGGVQDAGSNFISADDLTAAYNLGGGSKYDDSELLASIAGLTGDLSGLRSAFDKYKEDMQNMWNNANWGQGSGYGQAQTVGGVRTQSSLPGWSPLSGGTAGFFGRGGNRFGLSTKSLNI
jgi:hypothetical protein